MSNNPSKAVVDVPPPPPEKRGPGYWSKYDDFFAAVRAASRDVNDGWVMIRLGADMRTEVQARDLARRIEKGITTGVEKGEMECRFGKGRIWCRLNLDHFV